MLLKIKKMLNSKKAEKYVLKSPIFIKRVVIIILFDIIFQTYRKIQSTIGSMLTTSIILTQVILQTLDLSVGLKQNPKFKIV